MADQSKAAAFCGQGWAGVVWLPLLSPGHMIHYTTIHSSPAPGHNQGAQCDTLQYLLWPIDISTVSTLRRRYIYTQGDSVSRR